MTSICFVKNLIIY